jgi:hypothetical protein
MIAKQIESDAPHPRSEGAIHVEFVELSIRRNEGILRQVFRLMRLIEPYGETRTHGGLMSPNQFRKRRPRTSLRLGDEV